MERQSVRTSFRDLERRFPSLLSSRLSRECRRLRQCQAGKPPSRPYVYSGAEASRVPITITTCTRPNCRAFQLCRALTKNRRRCAAPRQRRLRPAMQTLARSGPVPTPISSSNFHPRGRTHCRYRRNAARSLQRLRHHSPTVSFSAFRHRRFPWRSFSTSRLFECFHGLLRRPVLDAEHAVKTHL